MAEYLSQFFGEKPSDMGDDLWAVKCALGGFNIAHEAAWMLPAHGKAGDGFAEAISHLHAFRAYFEDLAQKLEAE
jgi:hypothetical protein